MMREIVADALFTRREIGKEALDSLVLEALRRVPRHEFVTSDLRGLAYHNGPLPIGHGQTISQPFIVALMTDLLEPKPEDRILEIGTGSGYQAAVLSCLVSQVYSVEIVEALAQDAAERLQRLDYSNVECRIGDGYNGWPEHAPYDGIIVTAAAPVIPKPLIEQLKPGGRLVLPVGRPYGRQELTLVEKRRDGEGVRSREILGVAFVPFTGSQAARDLE
jgi:protein-L-isoaspartate(D-aspartate) O-methyltransferase